MPQAAASTLDTWEQDVKGCCRCRTASGSEVFLCSCQYVARHKPHCQLSSAVRLAPTWEVHNAPGLPWVQLVQLLHLRGRQHLILRAAHGRCSAARVSMKRVPWALPCPPLCPRLPLCPGLRGAAWLSKGRQAQASIATSSAPNPCLQRRQEERGQRLELLQARHVVPVIAHQEVAGPVGSKQGRLARDGCITGQCEGAGTSV